MDDLLEQMDASNTSHVEFFSTTCLTLDSHIYISLILEVFPTGIFDPWGMGISPKEKEQDPSLYFYPPSF
ncbi:MAG: hypothetical protein ACM3O8_04795 [Methylococcaceae bacterium]